MPIKLRESILNDYALIKLHPRNIEEIEALSGVEPDICLAALWDNSIEKITVLDKEQPICLFGVMPPNNLWLFFADVTELPVSFFKESRRMVKRIRELYPDIEGWIYSKNIFALQWSKWVGWNIDEPIPYGKEGKLFYRFH